MHPLLYTVQRSARKVLKWARGNTEPVQMATSVSDEEKRWLRQKRQRAQLEAQIGLSGLQVMAGLTRSDYNTDLDTLAKRASVYEKMRANASLSSLETIITLPLINATWTVQPADPSKRSDRKIADDLQANLMQDMITLWDDFVGEALWAVFSGVQVFEKVFRVEGGRIRWHRFASRPMETIDGWLYDQNGNVAAMKQRGWNTPPEKEETSTYVEAVIPIEKLLIFTYRKRKSDIEGRGLFRDAYAHWYYLQALRTLAGIRIERTACGTPYVIYEDGTSDEAIDELLATLKRIRTSEESGAVFPPTVREIGNLDLGDPGIPFLDAIMNEQQQILRIGLAQFLGLGQGENAGAYALSADLSNLFISAENAIARWFCSYFTRYCIQQWVVYNYGPQERYPTLTHSRLELSSPMQLQTFLVSLFESGLPDRPDEVGDYVRQLFQIPKPTTPPTRPAGTPTQPETSQGDEPYADVMQRRRDNRVSRDNANTSGYQKSRSQN